MLKKLYKIGSRFMPMDIIKVLAFDVSQLSRDANSTDISTESLRVEFLSSETLGQLVNVPDYELNHATVNSIDGESVLCVGVYAGSVLAGYTFFCTGPVEAQRNSGGSAFTGIAMEFSESVRYLYKAYVLPKYRGKQIAQHIIRFALTDFKQSGVEFIVTTTDWTNTAFLRTADVIGFKSLGLAGEYKLFGKHRYVLPGKSILNDETNCFVSLHKPG